MRRTLSLAEIFQLGYYWESKALLTAVTLNLFDALAESAATAPEIATRLHTNPEASTLLLNALVAMGLLRKDGEKYANSAEAQEFLIRDSPQYAGHILLLQDAEWNNWGQLEASIRTGRSPVTEHLFRSNPRLAENVLTVLHRLARQHAPVLATQLNLNEAKTLLDLGGGAGTYAIAFCRAYPRLQAVIFDLPETLHTAERMIKEAALEQRITLRAGDFNQDRLGGPYDAVLMSDILHYQGPAANAALVRKVYQALSPSGRLFIKDRFLDEGRTSPAWTTVFALHLLVNTEKGQCYTLEETRQWLREAGFSKIQEIEPSTLIEGIR